MTVKEKIENYLLKSAKYKSVNPDKYFQFINKALFLGSKYKILESKIYYELGIYYNLKGEFNSSLKNILKSLELFNSDSDSEIFLAKIYSYLGNIYYKVHKPVESLNYLLKAIKLQTKLNAERDLVLSYIRLGTYYNTFEKEFKKSIDIYKKAMKIAQKIGEIELQNSIYGGIASGYFDANNFSKAIKYYKLSLDLCDRYKNDYIKINNLNELAKCYYYLENYNESLKFNNEYLKYSKIFKNDNDIFGAFVFYVLIYFKLGMKQEVEKYLKLANDHEKFVSDKIEIYTTYRTFSTVFGEAGDYEKEIYYFRKYHDKYVESLNDTLKKEIKEMKAIFEKEQAEKEAEIYKLKSSKLEKEIEIKKQELSKTANYMVMKNEFIDNFSSEIKEYVKSTEVGANVKIKLFGLIKELEKKKRTNEDLFNLETTLNKINMKFIGALSKKYPGLTKTELKICSMMKSGLDTEHITKLLSVSVRTLQNHRHHIIKKLNLSKGKSLVYFINRLN